MPIHDFFSHRAGIYAKDPLPERLWKIGVAPINKEVYKKIKKKYDSLKKNKLLESEEIKKIFINEGRSSFFAVKKHQKKNQISDWIMECLMEIYDLVYFIDKKFEKNKLKYSAEEISMLFFLENIQQKIETYLWRNHYLRIIPEDIPYSFKLEKYLDTLPKKLIYVVDYLKELGYTSKPQGVMFKEVLKKQKQGPFKIIYHSFKNKRIHHWLTEEIKKLKKEIMGFEKKEGQLSEEDGSNLIY